MKLRLVLFIALWFCSQVGMVSYAQLPGNEKSFDPKMSLEQTLGWLSKQITDVRTVPSVEGNSSRRLEIRVLKAKGCTFSYSSATQRDGLTPSSTNVDERELWTINLASLDPGLVRATQSQWETVARVSFTSNRSPNAINTSVFHNDRLQTHASRRWGYLFVRDLSKAEEVAAGLRHAIELCQQSGAPVK